MNIDIIIKIFTYLRKLIPDTEFLKLRLLRKKIANVFCPKYFFFTGKIGKFFNFMESAQKTSISTLKVYDNISHEQRFILAKMINDHPHINKIIIVIFNKRSSIIYCPIPSNIIYDNNYNYSNITSYKGPYITIINELSSLKKITVYNLISELPFFPGLYLEKLTLYLNNSVLCLTVQNYEKLEYLRIIGHGRRGDYKLNLNINLKYLIMNNHIAKYAVLHNLSEKTKITIIED